MNALSMSQDRDMLGVYGRAAAQANEHCAERTVAMLERLFMAEVERVSVLLRAGEVLGYPVVLV